MTSDSRIFHPIPRSPERDLILSEIASSLSDVYVKIARGKMLLVKAVKWTPPFKLLLTYPEGVRPVLRHAVPIQMTWRGDKYFAMAFLQDSGTQLMLVIEGPLYKIQRRQSFRLRLPSDYPIVAKIFEVNGHALEVPVKVLDLSEGGCSLFSPMTMNQSMGSYIGFEMKIRDRGTFLEYGHVRYLKSEKNAVRLGVKFDSDNKTNSDLFNLIRDLYIELFSKRYHRGK